MESRLNAGADELAILEVIVCSPEDLKYHMVRVQGKARNFREFVCVYNIFTRIQKCTKREETMLEFMKHKKDLVSLKISKDEAITVYTWSIRET